MKREKGKGFWRKIIFQNRSAELHKQSVVLFNQSGRKCWSVCNEGRGRETANLLLREYKAIIRSTSTGDIFTHLELFPGAICINHFERSASHA